MFQDKTVLHLSSTHVWGVAAADVVATGQRSAVRQQDNVAAAALLPYLTARHHTSTLISRRTQG